MGGSQYGEPGSWLTASAARDKTTVPQPLPVKEGVYLESDSIEHAKARTSSAVTAPYKRLQGLTAWSSDWRKATETSSSHATRKGLAIFVARTNQPIS